MKKKAKPARQPVKPGTQFSGGAVQGLGPAPGRKPPPRHAAPRKVAPRPVLFSGGAMQPVPVKTVARKKPVKRKLALGEAVACCAAEALAASLRVAGYSVADADVLALYELTADGPDEGATIEATLEAAASRGLAGLKLTSFEEVMPCESWSDLSGYRVTRAGLILGADLPGPHALCDDGAAWWSWGWPYDPADFPDAVIEEAWQVTW